MYQPRYGHGAAGAGREWAGHGDARALLDAALTGPLDARVRDQIVAETRGNRLALLELLRRLARPSWPAGSACRAPGR